MTTIRCIDFETTGIPTETDPHAIVEIGWCDLVDDVLKLPKAVLCDPGRPIPHEAMAVHHSIKAKLESVESGIETFEESFLAHIQMPDGITVGEYTKPAIARAYESGTMQPLLQGPKS